MTSETKEKRIRKNLELEHVQVVSLTRKLFCA